MSRFASITADLLARKGDARPWQPAADWTSTAPVHHATPLPPHDEPVPDDALANDMADDARPVRRCTIRLSECEYQRLGIVAVKKDVTRQQILRLAVEEYLAATGYEYGRDCGCLGGRTCRSEKPRQGPRTF